MNREPISATLTEDDLRVVAFWAADCAERMLRLFEAKAPSDTRPRAALEGCRAFARGGRRTAHLRTLVWAAYAAAREVGDPAAAAAARAAGVAAGVAYTHAQASPDQTKHALAPAAYAALASELAAESDPGAGDAEVRWAIEHASAAVREIVQRMPEYTAGRGRLDTRIRELEVGLRNPG